MTIFHGKYPVKACDESESTINVSCAVKSNSSVAFQPILPVWLNSSARPNRQFEVNAQIDTGSLVSDIANNATKLSAPEGGPMAY